MLESYRKMTNAHLCAHEENVMTFLRADERFLDCEEDAAELGLSLGVGIHETYSAETKGLRAAKGDKFPYGYSSELEIDFIRNGRIVMTAPKDGKSVQMSVTATIVRTPETMFFRKIELIPYDELIEDETLFHSIEDFLDQAEDEGVGYDSPFLADENEHAVPTEDLDIHTLAELPKEGAYVEIQGGAFMGAFGRAESLYLSRDAALPYRIFLSHVLGERYVPGGVMTLENDDAGKLLSLLDAACTELPGCILFSDLLTRLGVYELTPPPNAEKLLTAVTVGRQSDFIANTEALRECLAMLLEKHGAIAYLDTPA
jgi:hypothetical protein